MHNPIKTNQIVRNTEVSRGTDWFFTSKGEPRGYIQPESLRELWFHTGTLCNLRCPFCFEGSGPGRMRLECPSEEDVAPFIAEAVELGVEKFSFTGGEPFVNPHMVAILQRALQHRPCLVLTNGTEPLRNRLHQLSELKDSEHPLSFRISLDSPDPEKHERGRGKGNFKLSLRVMHELLNLGFRVSVATLRDPNGGDYQERFQAVFREHGLPGDIPVVAFPDLLPPESRPAVPEITENCMTTYKTAEERAQFMCNYSKMVVKRNGLMQVYACTLVDDAPEYELGMTLREAMRERVMLKHHRCFSCFSAGTCCSEKG